MKSTGIVRPLDKLGRVVLPIELRRNLGINDHDPLEIFVEGDKIILGKYGPRCILCGGTGKHVTLHEKLLCQGCVEDLKR